MATDTKEKIMQNLRSKSGRAAAVNAMCCECIYDPDAAGCGSWRKQVEDCTSYNCPVYNFRPVTASGKNEET